MGDSSSGVREIGSRLELFVDDYLIGEMRGTALRLGRPVARETALAYGKPWEGVICGYPTVIKDGDAFRLYYRGVDLDMESGYVFCACYAESDDGIHFTRPDLGICEAPGGGPNNIIIPMGRREAHNFAPFIDTRPGVAEEERFKAVGGTAAGEHSEADGFGGLFGLVSPDGVHWRRTQQEAIIPPDERCKFDTHNSAFWSEHEGCYVCYVRSLHYDEEGGRYRWFSRAMSDDFIHWSQPEEMEFGEAPPEELYTNGAQPYFRAPHIYLFLAARFCKYHRAMTDEQGERLGLFQPVQAASCSDGVFLSSRGGNHADRTFMEAFVRPDIGLENWSTRTNYPAMGVVQTGEDELSFYVNCHYCQPTCHIKRYTIRVDGFASVNAPYARGEMVTKPLRFEGSRLMINYATSAAGSVYVAIEDQNGKPIPGYGLDECKEILGNEIAREVCWENGPDVRGLSGRTVRLRFSMRDADLFSLRFSE